MFFAREHDRSYKTEFIVWTGERGVRGSRGSFVTSFDNGSHASELSLKVRSQASQSGQCN